MGKHVEPRMQLYLLHVDSPVWIREDQVVEEISERLAEPAAEGKLCVDDFVDDFNVTLRNERNEARTENIQNNSRRPKVCSSAIPLSQKNFGRNISRCLC